MFTWAMVQQDIKLGSGALPIKSKTPWLHVTKHQSSVNPLLLVQICSKYFEVLTSGLCADQAYVLSVLT